MKICPACQAGCVAHVSCPECGAELGGARARGATELDGLLLARRYRVSQLVGQGAMAWVYRGLHQELGTTVAVKLRKPHRDRDAIRARRFDQEAKLVGQLNHPNIIAVLDHGYTPGGLHYMISEYVSGPSLTELVQHSNRLPVPRALDIADQLLSALAEAHQGGMVHRDLKPDNILLHQLRDGGDLVKILDFGIAKSLNPPGPALTLDGHVCGTPVYMAPEVVRGGQASPRSDLYACGILLYWMLSGENPFDAYSVEEAFDLQLNHIAAPLQVMVPDAELTPELDRVVLRTLSKDPRRRFADATSLRRALRQSVHNTTLSPREAAVAPTEDRVGDTVARLGDGPLEQESVERLLDEVLSVTQHEAATLAQQILSSSQGNAQHTIQAVRLLHEGGNEVQASLSNLLASRVSLLPAPALKLLQGICALGPAATIDQLWQLLDPAQVELSLTLLASRGLIQRRQSGAIGVDPPAMQGIAIGMMSVGARTDLLNRARQLHQATARRVANMAPISNRGAGRGERI